jgi:hypothetical protein
VHPTAPRSSPSPTIGDADGASLLSVPAPADSFAERARQLVEFLIGSPDTGGMRRREHELTEWIARWREGPQHPLGGQQHFVPEELGIIVRALGGPGLGQAPPAPPDNQTLRWLLARSASDAA